jgi:hypothetical protein
MLAILAFDAMGRYYTVEKLKRKKLYLDYNISLWGNLLGGEGGDLFPLSNMAS